MFALRRVAAALATLLFAALAVFLVLEILPGDPAQVILGSEATPEQIAALRLQLGLDRPAPVRFFAWLADFATGEFGLSLAYRVPVAGMIAERLAITLPLALMATLLTVVAGLAVGLFAAARHGRPADTIVMGLAQIGLSIPNFWFALLLILLFAVHLQWFAAGGFPGWGGGVRSALAALVLPAAALATVQTAILARFARSALLDVLGEDYVRTARAKGLSRSQTIVRHALRNAMIPIITVIGLQFGNLLVGAIVVEQVFSLPGMGRLVFQAIANRDLEVVKATVLFLVTVVILVNLVVDLLYVAIDPRLSRR